MSAQPVAPSFGIRSLTGTFAACSVFVWYGHEAPIVASPFLNSSISSEASPQYFLTSGRCFFSSATAASNCVLFSSYGSLIPSAGCVFDQVERRVRDLDRVVRDGDLALVLRVVDRRPARRAPASPSACCRAACSGPTGARSRSACRRPCCSAATGTSGRSSSSRGPAPGRRAPRRRRRSGGGWRRRTPRPGRTGRRRPERISVTISSEEPAYFALTLQPVCARTASPTGPARSPPRRSASSAPSPLPIVVIGAIVAVRLRRRLPPGPRAATASAASERVHATTELPHASSSLPFGSIPRPIEVIVCSGRQASRTRRPCSSSAPPPRIVRGSAGGR